MPLPSALAHAAIVAVVAVAACGRFANDDTRMDNAERIISVSKQQTEIIYALGADEDLVAVDVSSVYPPEVKKLPTVGYHRALSIEGLLSARPTLIIHSGPESIGPEHVVRQLESLNIPMMSFNSASDDIEGAKSLIREMGDYFHKKERAEELVAKLDADMKRAFDNAEQYPDSPSVVIIHFGRASNVYLTITRRSVAGQMLEWAGGRLAINDSGGMKRLTSPEIIAQANPDVILLTEFGYDRLSGLSDILELPGVSTTKAARTGRIFRIEEHDLIYLGPRTGENVLKLRELIHRPGSSQLAEK